MEDIFHKRTPAIILLNFCGSILFFNTAEKKQRGSQFCTSLYKVQRIWHIDVFKVCPGGLLCSPGQKSCLHRRNHCDCGTASPEQHLMKCHKLLSASLMFSLGVIHESTKTTENRMGSEKERDVPFQQNPVDNKN